MGPVPAVALVVDDDPVIRDLIADRLRDEPFEVIAVGSLGEARAVLRDRAISVLILDLNLGDGDGINLCRELRAAAFDGALIMVSARDAMSDRILGLELGADDYLIKPFDARELVARLRSVLRRISAGDQKPARPRYAVFGCWRLDLLRRRLMATDGRVVMLTTAEFRVLHRFTEAPGVVLAREDLQPDRSATAAFDRSTDMLISRLRQKLGGNEGEDTLILTVRNEGYVLAATVTFE